MHRAADCFSCALQAAANISNWNHRPIVLGNRSAAYFMLGRYPEVVDDCETALKLDPTLFKLAIRVVSIEYLSYFIICMALLLL